MEQNVIYKKLETNEEIIGCVGIRKLENKICEMKRLFVNDNYRGQGIGKTLAEMIIKEAKLKHYEKSKTGYIEYNGSGFKHIP